MINNVKHAKQNATILQVIFNVAVVWKNHLRIHLLTSSTLSKLEWAICACVCMCRKSFYSRDTIIAFMLSNKMK